MKKRVLPIGLYGHLQDSNICDPNKALLKFATLQTEKKVKGKRKGSGKLQ